MKLSKPNKMLMITLVSRMCLRVQGMLSMNLRLPRVIFYPATKVIAIRSTVVDVILYLSSQLSKVFCSRFVWRCL